MPYLFLGGASYVRQEGTRPMNITWRLNIPTQTGHPIRTNCTLIPKQAGRSIRRKLDTESDGNWDTFRLCLGLRPGSFPQSGHAG